VLNKLNPEGQDTLTFEELVGGLFRHVDFEDFTTSTKDQQPANILQRVFDNDRVRLAESSDFLSQLDPKREKYNGTYDEMLRKFGEWKAYIPDGEGRRLDIMKGCFVGSENPKVVEALRVIYVDYKPLRFCGDMIYKIVSTIMGTVERRQHRKV
jgi:hypothetical protein